MYNAHPSITSPLDRLVHCIAYIYIYILYSKVFVHMHRLPTRRRTTCVRPWKWFRKIIKRRKKKNLKPAFIRWTREWISFVLSYFIYTRIVTILSSSFEFVEILQRILIFSKKKKEKINDSWKERSFKMHTHTHLEIKFNSRL